jgi:acid phosphatase (class A)
MVKNFSEYINEQYVDNAPLGSKLSYGNPQKYQKEKMYKGSELFNKVKELGLLDEWKSSEPLDQDSEAIKKELESLIVLGDSQTEEDKQFVKDAEKDLTKIFSDFLRKNGIDYIDKKDIDAICDELDPLTYTLKYHFNYPRPYQLASALNISLYPSQPTDACSPSYPSGHSIDSFVIAGLIAKKFPQLKKQALALGEKTSKSRLLGGIHFPSDAEFGKKIAEEILDQDLLSL